MSAAAKICFTLAAILLLYQAGSLVFRVAHEQTDFSVYYNTAVELKNGAGGEIYSQRDWETGWQHCIPPAGTAVFQPLPFFSKPAAAVLWALVNLALIGISLALLWNTFIGIERDGKAFKRSFPWTGCVLLVLSSASIQVGQFSSLFAALWTIYLWATVRGRPLIAGLALAFPAAIKLYPALLALVSLLRGKGKDIVWFAVWLIVFSAAIPLLIYGSRFMDLSMCFIQASVLDPAGRITGAMNPNDLNNAGLDAILLRYFTGASAAKAPWLPHLNLSEGIVFAVANAIRLVIFGITILGSLSLVRRKEEAGRVWTAVVLLALWCAALYLLAPGMKARYAAYLFPAFIPAIAFAAAARGRQFLIWSVGVVVLLVLSIQAIPQALSIIGIPLLAPVALWLISLRAAQAQRTNA